MDSNRKDILYKLEMASGDINDARRYLDTGEAINRVYDELRAALMWAIEAWLVGHGHKPNVGNGWTSMQFQFLELAPEPLRSKASCCLSEETFLQFELEGGVDFKEPLPSIEKWKEDAHACMEKVEEVVSFIEKGVSPRKD